MKPSQPNESTHYKLDPEPFIQFYDLYSKTDSSEITEFIKQLPQQESLNKVAFPIYSLQPRSFVEKISDHFIHCDFLSDAGRNQSKVQRIVLLVQWYLSGFHHVVKYVRKPYDSVLGEIFRCYWIGKTGHRTYFISEQVSQNPPLSTFYVSNREDGFVVEGSIGYDNVIRGSTIYTELRGAMTVKFLKYHEEWTIPLPKMKVTGLFTGQLTMEVYGPIQFKTEGNPFEFDIEFKTVDKMSSKDYQGVEGVLKKEGSDIFSIKGRYTTLIQMTRVGSKDDTTIFLNSKDLVKCPQRYIVVDDELMETETYRIWKTLTASIKKGDSGFAAKELARIQQEYDKDKKEYKPKLFESVNYEWKYKYKNYDVYNSDNDVPDDEKDGEMKYTHKKKL